LGAPASAAERVTALTVELLTRTGWTDDVTVLAARRLPEPVAPLRVDLPATVESVATGREALHAWLLTLEPDPADRTAVLIAAGELLANAAEHAGGGHIRCEADLDPDGTLLLRVHDQGSWRTPDPTLTHRGRGLMLVHHLIDEVHIDHAAPTGASAGAVGTTVTLRHRISRPAVLGPGHATAPRPASNDEPFGVELLSSPRGQERPDVTARVRVRGPADAATAPALERELTRACRGGVLPLSVDLTAVEVLTSAAVAVLYRTRERLHEHGNRLQLIAPSGRPAAVVLTLVGLAPDPTGLATA
jgi:anti-anti-sigma factor